LAALDSFLPEGGLAAGALHEIVPAPHSMPSAFGFTAAILARLFSSPPDPHAPERGKVFLVLPAYGFRHYGRPHGHGLQALGLDPARLILVETAHRRDTLWAIEETLRSGAPKAVAGLIDTLDLKSSQRLHFAAAEAGLPLFLLRPATSSACRDASAAATRWRIGTAEAARDRFGLVTHPRWRLTLERARNGRPGEWVVEYDHVAHRFSLAAALADPARARGPGAESSRQPHCA
jgi:protein ImuA